MKVEIGLATVKLKERIITYLEERYRKTGKNEAVCWRGIWIEFGAAEEDFCLALQAAAAADGEAGIVFTDSDHIKLRNRLLRNITLAQPDLGRIKTEASEQIYDRGVMFMRTFFHFVKRKGRRSTAIVEG